jgi:CRISPR-associated protein Csx16
MTTFFITRHPGAREWAGEESIAIDRLVTHLDPENVQPRSASDRGWRKYRGVIWRKTE